MPNTYTNLSDLFTAIANAIREKTGGSSPIIADNFPTAIAAIETGSNILLEPTHNGLGGGYVYTGWWIVNSTVVGGNDVYQVESGHTYFCCNGASAEERCRMGFFATDPALASADFQGTQIGDDESTPTPYIINVFTANSNGYVAIYKGNISTDPETIVIDVTGL